MLWEVEVRGRPQGTNGAASGDGAASESRVYLLDGPLEKKQVERLAGDLLADATIEDFSFSPPLPLSLSPPRSLATVLLKPGVMDPVAESVENAIVDLGLPATRVRTAKRFHYEGTVKEKEVARLANDAIEQVVVGPLPESAWAAAGSPYTFRLINVPIREMNDDDLQKLSREGQLYLSLAEMQTIRDHFRALGRDATDAELETLAQTWSEHCSHKTLKGRIEFNGSNGKITYDNLLKETIFHATQEIRRRLGKDDWCVSVFEDNAGIIRFDDKHHVCFKVETHNHPSAIEPYGGANTGLGGVIRDVLGTGLGGKPIANTDVFCFAPPDFPAEKLPPGVLPPKKVMTGVVAGVRDYGNRMGIPTVNGAICFDERYLGNPLVFCGTVGLIPAGKEHKEPKPGDLIVAVGGRTGRDGIHGATFSSAELTHESEQISGGAVQIGNAITEKKMLDVLLKARDLGLYHAITDCGAGGFSSAVGEMGEKIGAEVHLERAPLKYEGLSYTEIWISEAQERMVLAVPPASWDELQRLCASEGVEASVIGEFKPTGRLTLHYQGKQVADLDMKFLHGGRPRVVRKSVLGAPHGVAGDGVFGVPGEPASGSDALPGTPKSPSPATRSSSLTHHSPLTTALLKILCSLNVCSKEWVIRQYDHEVQGGTVIKPLVGVANDGPGDAAVITPVLGSNRGLAIGCGLNPCYGDLDPYWMAASAIDEAVRNVVAVGADPSRIALLDNFCWGNTDRPEVLGSLVRAAEACRDIALAYGTPFVSGKDSLNNEFHAGEVHITIPPTLLISAMGIVPDVRKCVTMDLKKPGNLLFLVGATADEMGGSHFHLVNGMKDGSVPRVDLELAPKMFRKLHEAIQQGLIRACHDLSEGGLAVAIAEMCLAGGYGARLETLGFDNLPEAVYWFSESNARFVLEVTAPNQIELQRLLADLPCVRIGVVTQQANLEILDRSGSKMIEASLIDLKAAWQRPLKW